MSWLETVRIGWQAIVAHRLRSLLTALGILIGIAAVIVTVGLGEGAQQQVSARIAALGSNLLIVSPGSSSSTTSPTGVRGGLGSASTLTVGDATALANSPAAAPDIAAVAPTVQRSEPLAAGSATWTTTVIGTTPSWLTVRARQIAEGRFLTNADAATNAAVAVLGPITAQQLYGRADPLGKLVLINNVPFTVVGVLASAGSNSSTNLDDQAIVPMAVATTRLFGGPTRNSVQSIYLQARSASDLSAAYQEATTELLALHHITNPTAADFTITAQQTLLSTATSVSRTMTVLLAGVAALSLLVGGIGVMNIMLVSVTERTREIGLRKALGAAPRLIRRQFLVEAAGLGLTGGLLGVALGVGTALLLPPLVGDPVAISPSAIGLALAVSVLLGVGFGVYPAGRAARLAPIDALRTE